MFHSIDKLEKSLLIIPNCLISWARNCLKASNSETPFHSLNTNFCLPTKVFPISLSYKTFPTLPCMPSKPPIKAKIPTNPPTPNTSSKEFRKNKSTKNSSNCMNGPMPTSKDLSSTYSWLIKIEKSQSPSSMLSLKVPSEVIQLYPEIALKFSVCKST